MRQLLKLRSSLARATTAPARIPERPLRIIHGPLVWTTTTTRAAASPWRLLCRRSYSSASGGGATLRDSSELDVANMGKKDDKKASFQLKTPKGTRDCMFWLWNGRPNAHFVDQWLLPCVRPARHDILAVANLPSSARRGQEGYDPQVGGRGVKASKKMRPVGC